MKRFEFGSGVCKTCDVCNNRVCKPFQDVPRGWPCVTPVTPLPRDTHPPSARPPSVHPVPSYAPHTPAPRGGTWAAALRPVPSIRLAARPAGRDAEVAASGCGPPPSALGRASQSLCAVCNRSDFEPYEMELSRKLMPKKHSITQHSTTGRNMKAGKREVGVRRCSIKKPHTQDVRIVQHVPQIP